MKYIFYMIAFMIAILSLQSCAVVGGIFKAGAIFGIIGVLIVVGIVVLIIYQVRKRNK